MTSAEIDLLDAVLPFRALFNPGRMSALCLQQVTGFAGAGR